jgi:hypothetical protein
MMRSHSSKSVTTVNATMTVVHDVWVSLGKSNKLGNRYFSEFLEILDFWISSDSSDTCQMLSQLFPQWEKLALQIDPRFS